MKIDAEKVEKDMDLIKKSIGEINSNLTIAKDVAAVRAEAITVCANKVKAEMDSLIANTRKAFDQMPKTIW